MKDNNNGENILIDETSPLAASGYHSSSALSPPQAITVGNPTTTTSNTTTTTSDDRNQKSSVLFDYVDKEIDEDLSCPICLNPFIDPITHSSCEITFCSSCIQNVTKCPICSEVDFKKNCSPSPKMIRNLLDKLKVKCDMCKNIVLRGELKDHREKYCPLHDAYKQVDELKLKLEAEFNQKNEQLKSEYFELIKQLKDEKEQTNQRLKIEHDQLIQQLKAEKEQSMKDAKENLMLKERELILKVKSSEEELEKRIQEFEKKVLVREKVENSNKPIHLNVRGTIMTVALGDFIHNEREPDNLFKKMFTGEYPLHKTASKQFDDPVYFIDCDPVVFKHILEWLKFGRLAIELTIDTKTSLIDASVMFQMINLSKKLGDSNNSPSQKEKPKMSQFDFITLTNLSRSLKITLNLSGLDLRGLSLQNTNLEKSEIISSDFSGMNLTHAKFNNSILSGCNFSNCDLTNVDFNGCDLTECNFSNAILKNTDMSNCNLSNQDFTGFQFTNVNFSNSILDGSNFENVTFNKCSINQLHFKKNNLKDCKLIDCDWNGSIFEEIDLNESLLLTTSFNECIFKNCDLTLLKDLSKFIGNTFDECLFNFEQFTNKTIGYIQFKNIDFNSQHLINFEFKNVQYHNCKLDSQSFILLPSSNIVKENIIISNEIISHTNSKSIPQLLYRGSRDGFKAKDFHSKCDLKGPTLTIIKSSEPYNQIFGGFTTQSWKSSIEWISDDLAFLFKIDENNQFKKFNIKQDMKHAIVSNTNYLPMFGHDIRIYNDCNLNNDSYSNFGNTYELPPPSTNNNEYQYESEKARSYLAGSEYFKVSEIEVFKIIQ